MVVGKELRNNQQGSVSIGISGLIMGVLIVITLSLLMIMNSHFKQITEIDRNLQAHYAAETGIWEARKGLYDEAKKGSDLQAYAEQKYNSENCSETEGLIDFGDIKFQCVQVDLDPPNLRFDRVRQDRSLILPLRAIDEKGSYHPLKDLTIRWDQPEPNIVSEFFEDATKTLLPYNEWQGKVPLLIVRITVLDFNQTDNNREKANKQTKSVFLYPNEEEAEFDFLTNSSGEMIGGNCGSQSGQLVCGAKIIFEDFNEKIKIAEPAADADPNKEIVYLVRIQTVYNDAKIKISSSGVHQPMGFKDIQATIKSTGHSQNIYTRLEERVPLQPVFDYPEYGIDAAGTLCKALVFIDGYGVYIDHNLPYFLWRQRSGIPDECYIRESEPDWEELSE